MEGENLAKRLKELRKRAKLTQEEVAEYLNVHSVTVSRWETGIDIPKTLKIKKLCEIFNCTETELLNGISEDQIKITLSYDWNKMKEANIDMTDNGFELILGSSGQVGIKGAGMLTSIEAINDFVLRIKNELEIAFETQKKRGIIKE